MKIGLTGGTGFIGQYLLRDYSDKYEFVVATSNTNKLRESTKDVQFLHSDYSFESFCQVFQNCNAIIHLGAHVVATSSSFLSLDPLAQNPVSAYNVFAAASELGIKNVINISSVAVYSQDEDKLYKESDICHPRGTYGIAKLATEELASVFNRQKDMNIVTLRLSQIVGYILGCGKSLKGGFYAMLLNNSIDSKPLTIYGDGRVKRDVLYVKDVTHAIDLVCKKFPDVHGIFNIGMGQPVSNMDLAEAYCNAFSNPSGISKVYVENEDISCFGIDVARANKELGYFPRYNINQMTEDIYQEYLMSSSSGDKTEITD